MNDNEKPVEVEQVKKTAFREIREGLKEPEGSEKGWKNLQPLNELPPEERKLRCRNGALKAAEVKRAKRTMKEALTVMLQDKELAVELAKATGNDILLKATEKGATVNDVLMLSAFMQGLEGNVKSLEFIRDTAGQKPKAELEVNSELTMISAADKALLDSARKIFGDFDEENDTEKRQ